MQSKAVAVELVSEFDFYGNIQMETQNLYPHRCSKCNAQMFSPVVCQSCQTLFDIERDVDYFTMFGFERKFDIDSEELEKRFIELSRLVHPDFHSNDVDNVMMLSMQITSELNQAYETLSDPIKRAEYLLALSGGPDAEKDKSTPEELLPYILHLRESFEFAQAQDDKAKTDEIRQSIKVLKEQTEQRIFQLARELNSPSNDNSLRSELRKQLNAIRYINNLARFVNV